MLISKADAARIAGFKDRRNIDSHKHRSFFQPDEHGKIKVNTEHPDWKLFLEQKKTGMLGKGGKPGRDKKLLMSDIIIGVEESEEEEERKPLVMKNRDEHNPEMGNLADQSLIADYKSKIFESRIKEEKAKQEEIKTAELKKDLAPMYLIKHFFSFGENMIHRSFRINHEIIPELNALFLSGKLQEAEQLLNERQETIVLESQAELIKAMKEEGYNTDGL